MSIDDVTVTEGNSGSSLMNFTVALSAASGRPVTVRATPVAATAKSVTDYTATAMNLTFAPGETSRTYSVQVVGDLLNEVASEAFAVVLSNPVSAVISRGTGTGTILDNDALPSLSINDVTAIEGNSATQTYTFTVTLSAPSARIITVSASTSSDSATSPTDFASRGPLTLTFQAGQVSRVFTVTVKGDTQIEPTETFDVILSGEVNATIADDTGTGTIVNDDGTGTIPPPSESRMGASLPAPGSPAVRRREGE